MVVGIGLQPVHIPLKGSSDLRAKCSGSCNQENWLMQEYQGGMHKGKRTQVLQRRIGRGSRSWAICGQRSSVSSGMSSQARAPGSDAGACSASHRATRPPGHMLTGSPGPTGVRQCQRVPTPLPPGQTPSRCPPTHPTPSASQCPSVPTPPTPARHLVTWLPAHRGRPTKCQAVPQRANPTDAGASPACRLLGPPRRDPLSPDSFLEKVIPRSAAGEQA